MSTITATSAPIETRLASKSDLAFGVFRILAALMFAMHGTVKLFGWPTGQAAAVGTWPMWWAGILEVVLGAMIAAGLATRVAAFIASGMMAVAYFWVHFPRNFWPYVNEGETAALYSFFFLTLVFTGPRALAVSHRF